MKLQYAEDSQGKLWIGSGNQVLAWKDGSFEPYLRKELLPFNGQAGVESVAAAADGCVWAAIPVKGVGLYQVASGVAAKANVPGIGTERVTKVFTDRDHALWMSSLLPNGLNGIE